MLNHKGASLEPCPDGQLVAVGCSSIPTRIISLSTAVVCARKPNRDDSATESPREGGRGYSGCQGGRDNSGCQGISLPHPRDPAAHTDAARWSQTAAQTDVPGGRERSSWLTHAPRLPRSAARPPRINGPNKPDRRLRNRENKNDTFAE